MAKHKSDDNKSEAIREVLRGNPKATVSEVRQTLEQKGTAVSSNLVYLVRSKMMAKNRKERRAEAVESGRKAGLSNPVELVLQVRSLAKQAGGYSNLKQLVEALQG